ncbi:MAG TPA: hypothetical protein DCZ94_20120 [Lentisphaeria bacterium]|nr:MAG: hypothetical protein A2X48_14765 [Lentisphaerae bacterium GWF2_49_21]HBC89253.1 hypothetical protein [Lentisphaeria bacterium]
MRTMMKVLVVLLVAMTVMADEKEAQEPRELTAARTAYLQKLETLKKATKVQESIDAIQAEIDKVKVEAAVADVKAAAPDKPGDKAAKLKEFPKDLTAADWDRLPGKVVKVSAEPGTRTQYSATEVALKANETIFLVPHPTDKWDLNKKVSCTWEGVKLEGPKFAPNARAGYMMLSASTGKSAPIQMRFDQLMEGPLQLTLYCAYVSSEYPTIYYKGNIRVKMVPAE